MKAYKRGSAGIKFPVIVPLILLVSCIVLVTADIVFARAGGGQSYSSSSSSSHSYSSHSSYSGSGSHSSGDGVIFEIIFRLLFWLVVNHPFIGIPLLVFLIVVIVKMKSEGSEEYVGLKIRTGMKAQENVARTQALAAIKQRDPGFEQAAFIGRSRKAFEKIQNAWSKQDLSKVQAFISDGVVERFSLQIEEQRSLGRRNLVENLRVLETQISVAESGTQFDALHIYIRASARDTTVSIKTGEKIQQSDGEEEFEEYWSFLRRPGAKTIKKPGLIEGFCPNCAANIEIGQTAKCESCGSFIRSGEYDWVLAEITQACEWSPNTVSRVVGLPPMTQEDPGFNIQQIEDRASTIFWRLAMTDRTGKVDYIRKMALETFCGELENNMVFNERGVRQYYGECAVGSVDTRIIVMKEDFDRVYVEIRWSGKDYSLDKKGSRTILSSMPRNIHTIFVLARKHGVKTDTRFAMISSHCPNCGASESKVEASVCEYCNTVLNDGSRDWVLETTMSPGSAVYQGLVQSTRPVKEKKIPGSATGPLPGVPEVASGSFIGNAMEGLTWMTHMMLADGIVDPAEMKQLEEYAKKRHIPVEKLGAIVESVKSRQVDIPLPSNRDESMELLRNLSSMALADGRVSPEETAALNSLGTKMGYSPIDVKMILKQEQRRLLELAKKAIIAERRFKV